MTDIIKEKQKWIMNIPIKSNEFTHYQFIVSYNKGSGKNDYRDIKRGYYLFMSPVRIENCGSYTITSGNPRLAQTFILEQTDKFNPKNMDRVATEILNDTDYITGCIKSRGYEPQ